MLSLFEQDKNKPASPGWLNIMAESTVWMEYTAMLVAAPWLATAPQGDGHPVLVLPGFMASDMSTAPLRNFLTSRGYNTHSWELGRNLGPQPGVVQGLEARFHQLHQITGRKVSVVGWSLGGLYARHLAHVFPDETRQVITLGTPIRHPESTLPAKMFQLLNRSIDATLMEELAAPPTVPTSAVYSPHDGVVPWQCSLQDDSPVTENIEVWGSHIGMGFRPSTLWLVAERLSQQEGQWQKFKKTNQTRYAVAPDLEWLNPILGKS